MSFQTCLPRRIRQTAETDGPAPAYRQAGAYGGIRNPHFFRNNINMHNTVDVQIIICKFKSPHLNQIFLY